MIEIIINRELSSACPSLQELEPSIVEIPPEETIDIRWENSRQEQVILEHHRNRNFRLYVPDLQSCERATSTLELPLTLDKSMVGDARLALTNKKLYNWREFSREKGATVARNTLLKIAADEIRNGNQPKLAHVVRDMFLKGVSPVNADTLLRLRLWGV